MFNDSTLSTHQWTIPKKKKMEIWPRTNGRFDMILTQEKTFFHSQTSNQFNVASEIPICILCIDHALKKAKRKCPNFVRQSLLGLWSNNLLKKNLPDFYVALPDYPQTSKQNKIDLFFFFSFFFNLKIFQFLPFPKIQYEKGLFNQNLF